MDLNRIMLYKIKFDSWEIYGGLKFAILNDEFEFCYIKIIRNNEILIDSNYLESITDKTYDKLWIDL